ncbi:unnamed protein product, partial [Prorocentrum cordatum]
MALAGEMAMEGPALQRAEQAKQVCAALCALGRSRCHPLTSQIAWTILVHSPARKLDYDMRLCASGVLHVARERVQAAVVRVLDALKGAPADSVDVETARLPPCLGGHGLRLPGEPEADASYLACWTAHAADARRLAEALGRPLSHHPDAELAEAAAARLRDFGVVLEHGRAPAFPAAAEAEYAGVPLSADTPVQDVFRFDGEIDGSSLAAALGARQPAGEAGAGPPAAAAEPTAARQDLEGARRRLLGRLFRGTEALRAGRLLRSLEADEERRANLWSHAGRGNGRFWLAIPRAAWMRVSSTTWHVAFCRRLGSVLAPPGAVCRLQRSAAVDGDDGGATRDCGEPLVRRAARALACPRSAIRLRTHTGAVRDLEDELRAAGAVVDVERW